MNLFTCAPRCCGCVLLAWAASVAAQTSSPVCKALVSDGSTLYVASGSGAILTKFAAAGTPLTGAALAPDGSAALFIPATNPQSFTVVNTSGGISTTSVPSASPPSLSAFTGVAWDTVGVVRTESHEGLLQNRFAFYLVPSVLGNALQAASGTGVGQACSMQAFAKALTNNVACIDASNVTSNGQKVYSEDIFAPNSTTQMTSFQTTVGATVVSQTTPSFTVQLLSLSGGVTLQISSASGQGVNQRTDSGTPIELQVGDDIYGFTPTITDVTNGVVQVSIAKSAFSDAVFDPAIAWQDPTHVLVVGRMPTGPQLRMVRTTGATSPLPSAPLTVADSVLSVHLVAQTSGSKGQGQTELLVFRTGTGFGYVPVTVTGPDPGTIQAGQVVNLPRTLTVSFPSGSASVEVLDWSCQ